uniref:NADH dehydrogenase subunit 4L n=1 Tax=Mutilla europaea TaxID=2749339 RepID=A0A7L7S9W3_9HYME|nr:NADH dehydrogenase subunit 4L [Mutilla europaea]
MLYMLTFMFGMMLFMYFNNYYYFLNTLLMMEYIFIMVLLFMMFSAYSVGGCNFLYVLILGICEGVLGLISIILVYRYWGSDMFSLVDYDTI